MKISSHNRLRQWIKIKDFFLKLCRVVDAVKSGYYASIRIR